MTDVKRDSSLPVLTLWQPWATLLMLRPDQRWTPTTRGVKWIETRPQPAPAKYVGQRVAIHAAAKPVPRALTDGGDGMMGDWWVVRDDSGPALLDHRSGHGQVTDLYGLPLGVILGTALLTETMQFVRAGDNRSACPCIVVENSALTLVRASGPLVNVSDQRPFGDFTPGRWGLLFDVVEEFERPIPFKGGQGWSMRWTPTNGSSGEPT